MAELPEPPVLIEEEEKEPQPPKKRKLPAARIRRSRAELEARIAEQEAKTAAAEAAVEKRFEEKKDDSAAGVGELPPAVRVEAKKRVRAEEKEEEQPKPTLVRASFRPPPRPAELRDAVDKFIEAKQPGYRWKLAGAAALAAGAAVYVKAPEIVMALGSSGLL